MMGEQRQYEGGTAPQAIDLGCGNNPRDGAVGVDIRDYPAVDVQSDIRDLPDAWTSSVETAYASQVLEHLSGDGIAATMAEVSRVLVPGGEFVFDVPYGRAYDNGDPTHETRWTFQTVAYYLPRDEVVRLGHDPELFPDYYQPDYDIDFELVARDADVWLDATVAPVRPFSWLLHSTSNRITTDSWDALPIVGPAVAGKLTFRLRKRVHDGNSA